MVTALAKHYSDTCTKECPLLGRAFQEGNSRKLLIVLACIIRLHVTNQDRFFFAAV